MSEERGPGGSGGTLSRARPGAPLYGGEVNGPAISAVPSGVATLLDVGCGTGGNAAALRAAGVLVDGVTLSEEEAEVARGTCRRVHVYDLEDGLPPDCAPAYDCCLCSHVLEHVAWPERLLRDVRERLGGTGGALVVALPNMLHFRNRLRLLAGRLEYERSGLMDAGHLRWYSVATAQGLLRRNGFVIERCWVDGHLPLPGVRALLPQRLSAVLDRTVCRL